MDIEGIVLEKRGVDHEDHRRALFTAFNGDLDGFTARHLFIWKTGPTSMERTIDGPTSATRTLFYLLEGTARVILREFDTGHTMIREFEPGNRLLLPSYDHRPIDYHLKLDPGSIMVQCGENGAGYQTPPRFVELHVAFNGRQGDAQSFQAKQVKMAKIKTELPLGAHSHTYREFFHILTGQGFFETEDPASKRREQSLVEQGQGIMIPAGMPHRVVLRAGSILVGGTEQPYLSPQQNDQPHDFGDALRFP